MHGMSAVILISCIPEEVPLTRYLIVSGVTWQRPPATLQLVNIERLT